MTKVERMLKEQFGYVSSKKKRLNEKEETGLIVKPSTPKDKKLLDKFFDEGDYYAEYNAEFNEYDLPNDEDTMDNLNRELEEEFNKLGISASFSSY